MLASAALVVVVSGVTRRSEQSTDAPKTTTPTPAASTATGLTTGSTDRSANLTSGSASGDPPITFADANVLTGLGLSGSVFAFTPGAALYPPTVVRVDLATGVEVDTTLPTSIGAGPVSVVGDPHGLIIRPLDSVPGYRGGDGEPPRPLGGLLADGGPAPPGA